MPDAALDAERAASNAPQAASNATQTTAPPMTATTTNAARPAPVSPLSARNAPPFVLPGEHFAAAVVFLLAGALGLVLAAPDLARGSFSSLRVIAVAHLFTLGWITTSIMGALYQFLPVAAGQPIRWARLAHVTFALYAPGLAAFVAGLALGRAALLLVGAATFGSGVLLFTVNLAATLKRARTRDVTWWALCCADFFLFITLLIGLALAGNLRWGFLGGGRLVALGTHLHIALAGWVLLVMVGVAHRLLPMFLLSHGAGDRFARAAVALLAAGAAVLTTLHHAPAPLARWLPAALLAAGLLAFLAQAASFYRHRHRPALDPGMRLAAVALALLGIALVLAAPVAFASPSPRVVTAYVLLLVLGIGLFVAAHYYKIVPFLVWYHRFGPLAGKRAVPRVNELYSARAATVATSLLALGVIGLAAAVLAGAPVATRAAAVVFLAGATIEAAQMFALWRTRP
jgi:hypothetical protein